VWGGVVKTGSDKGVAMAWIADRGGVAGVSSAWGGVSVDYHGGGGRCCDGQGARAHGLGHLVVGTVTGAGFSLPSVHPACETSLWK
jgi:hypothetical protein